MVEKRLLPTAKTPPKVNPEDYNILIHGKPKVGKSSFAAEFDSPVFLATEEGTNALAVYKVQVPDWLTFLKAAGEIAEGGHPFKTVVIDTVANLFRMCEEYVCAKAKVTHPSDLEYGKGWSLVRDEFARAVIKLSMLPYGLVMIAHSDDIEVKTRTGSITRTVPRLSKQAWDTVVPMADFILYFTSELTKDGEKRLMRSRPSENWEAGNRFLGDKFPAELSMGSTPREAFTNFKSAFGEATKNG